MKQTRGFRPLDLVEMALGPQFWLFYWVTLPIYLVTFFVWFFAAYEGSFGALQEALPSNNIVHQFWWLMTLGKSAPGYALFAAVCFASFMLQARRVWKMQEAELRAEQQKAQDATKDGESSR